VCLFCMIKKPQRRRSKPDLGCRANWMGRFVTLGSARNGPVYTGLPYRDLILFRISIPEFIRIYYIHLSVFHFYKCMPLFRI
jgi:hypothetical protein